MTGFVPATSWSQTRRSSQAELHPARVGDSLGGVSHFVNSFGKSLLARQKTRSTWNALFG